MFCWGMLSRCRSAPLLRTGVVCRRLLCPWEVVPCDWGLRPAWGSVGGIMLCTAGWATSRHPLLVHASTCRVGVVCGGECVAPLVGEHEGVPVLLVHGLKLGLLRLHEVCLPRAVLGPVLLERTPEVSDERLRGFLPAPPNLGAEHKARQPAAWRRRARRCRDALARSDHRPQLRRLRCSLRLWGQVPPPCMHL